MSTIDVAVKQITDSIKLQMESRSYRAANEMRNAALLVLRGQRSGRRYLVPGTKRYYQASAPGEPPAVRTGIFRLSWQPSAHVVFGSYISRIESDVRTDNGQHNLGQILEEGTRRMAPRPYKDRILDMAEPQIFKIYNKPYF
jgi:hypothetical protein